MNIFDRPTQLPVPTEPHGIFFKRDYERKEATKQTIDAIAKDIQELDFSDHTDFDNASKGPVGANDDPPVVYRTDAPKSLKVWDLTPYSEILDGTSDSEAPTTVNPSLWRNANLCMNYGIFEVVSGAIYQVRGFDISNITYVLGNTGWIVFDPLRGEQTAAKAHKLFMDHMRPIYGDRAVTGVIYSHSHVDHFGGVQALFDGEDSGDVPILAPGDFTSHAVSENVIAGTAMGRRSLYQYGNLLTPDEKGAVNIGLGVSVSTATTTLIRPTEELYENGYRTIDGVRMYFQLTPGSEAPSEMNTWFPGKNWLWMAENSTNTMHNVLTLRGAQVRDSLKWAQYLQETIDKFGHRAIVKFQAHHWPIWDHEKSGKIVEYLKKQRDVYKYIHDQSVRLMNHGYIGSEISEMIKFPPSLDEEFHIRGYYGTLRHNSRAVYQFYMGWYTSNPSDLNDLPPGMSAPRFVEYMGGVGEMLKKAVVDYDKGDYRWVAQVLKYAVFAEPDNMEARRLLADAYEQLGYQAESGPWRNEYLTGAQELRAGTPKFLQLTQMLLTESIIDNLRVKDTFDYVSVSLNAEKAYAYGKDLLLKFTLTDEGIPPLERNNYLTMTNCTMNSTTHAPKNQVPDLHVQLGLVTLNRLLTGFITLEDIEENPDQYPITVVSGDINILTELNGLLDSFHTGFPIVFPRDLQAMNFPKSVHAKPLPIHQMKKLVASAPKMAFRGDEKQQNEVSEQLGGLKLNIGPAAC